MQQHELSYTDLFNDAPREYAIWHLKQPAYRITDIAYHVRYNNAANFTRAFKYWTGMSPSEHRRSFTTEA